MDKSTFNTLLHFTEKLTRDPDDRIELVLMAWQESLRLGKRAEIPLLINFMKLRSKEIGFRCAFGAKISGKSIRDVWFHKPKSISLPIKANVNLTISDTLASYNADPLSMCIVSDFHGSLATDEQRFADLLVAGYSRKEISKKLRMSETEFLRVRKCVQEKAVMYLV